MKSLNQIGDGQTPGWLRRMAEQAGTRRGPRCEKCRDQGLVLKDNGAGGWSSTYCSCYRGMSMAKAPADEAKPEVEEQEPGSLFTDEPPF